MMTTDMKKPTPQTFADLHAMNFTTFLFSPDTIEDNQHMFAKGLIFNKFNFISF
jgi:hypothetical protein